MYVLKRIWRFNWIKTCLFWLFLQFSKFNSQRVSRFRRRPVLPDPPPILYTLWHTFYLFLCMKHHYKLKSWSNLLRILILLAYLHEIVFIRFAWDIFLSWWPQIECTFLFWKDKIVDHSTFFLWGQDLASELLVEKQNNYWFPAKREFQIWQKNIQSPGTLKPLHWGTWNFTWTSGMVWRICC